MERKTYFAFKRVLGWIEIERVMRREIKDQVLLCVSEYINGDINI